MRLILGWFHIRPTTIAFLDGIFISTAINMLTGIKDFEGYKKVYALVAILLLIALSICLLLSEQKASILQDKYADWEMEMKKLDAVRHSDMANWNTYIGECFSLAKKIKTDKQYNLVDCERLLYPVSKGTLLAIICITIVFFVGGFAFTLLAYL